MNGEMTPTVDWAIPRRYAALLAGNEDARLAFRAYGDKEGDAAGESFIGTFDECMPALHRHNVLYGHAVGIVASEIRPDAQGARAADIARCRVLPLDLDEAPLPTSFPVDPDVISETSPGKFQCHWFVAPHNCFDEHTAAVRALAEKYGGDPSVADITRVLRLPGTLHHKADPFLGRVLKWPTEGAKRPTLIELVAKLGLDTSKYREKKEVRATADAPFAKGERNSGLTSAAGHLWNAGLVGEQLLEALRQVNELRCNPPLPDSEVRKIAQGARKWESKADGPASGPGFEEPVTFDFAERARAAPPSVEWIVEDFLPAAIVALISGHGGFGKSTLILQLCVSAALGRPFLEMATGGGPVIYLSCEDDNDEIHRRLYKMLKGQRIKMDKLDGNLHIFDGSARNMTLFSQSRDGVGLTAAYGWLAETAERVQPKLIVLDNIGNVYGANEERGAIQQFIAACRALAPRATILLVGHISKVAAKFGGDEQYHGNTQWHNGPRMRMLFTKVNEPGEDGVSLRQTTDPRDPRRVLLVEKARQPVEPLMLLYSPDDGLYIRDTSRPSSPALRRANMRQEVLKAIAACHCTDPEVLVPTVNTKLLQTLGPLMNGDAAMLKAKPLTTLVKQLEAERRVCEVNVPVGGGRYRAAWRLLPDGWGESGTTPPSTWAERPDPRARGRPTQSTKKGTKKR